MPLWLTILISIISSGSVGAVIAGVLARRLERVKHELAGQLAEEMRRSDYVRGQIDNLYGPLAFLVSANNSHIASHRSVFDAYDSYFSNRSSTEKAQEEAFQSFKVAKVYMDFVDENNEKAEKILRDGWGWLDPEDVEVALSFITDVARRRVEFAEGKAQLPPGMYFGQLTKGAALTRPSFIRPEFIERFRKKLRIKQQELGGDRRPQIEIGDAAARPEVIGSGAESPSRQLAAPQTGLTVDPTPSPDDPAIGARTPAR